MDITEMKSKTDEQEKLVTIELQSVLSGYKQALLWVKNELLKEETPK